jgi:ribosomal protein L14
MIQKQTKLYVGDNTMILKVSTIHLYGGFFCKQTQVANYVLVSIPDRRITRPFITKNIYLGIIVTQKKNIVD